MRFVVAHPTEKLRKMVLDREELEIARVVFGKLPIVIVHLEDGVDYNKEAIMQQGPGQVHGIIHEDPPWNKKRKTDWVSAIIAGVILGMLVALIGFCIMMRAVT